MLENRDDDRRQHIQRYKIHQVSFHYHNNLDLDLILSFLLSWIWVCRMRFAPIYHSTSVLCGTKTTLGHSGWWMMPNSWSAATCRVAGPGNMTQPRHPLHLTAHSKHLIDKKKTRESRDKHFVTISSCRVLLSVRLAMLAANAHTVQIIVYSLFLIQHLEFQKCTYQKRMLFRQRFHRNV